MLIFNNLLINNNSERYQPFLFNVVSGRRRLLADDEVTIIKRMVNAEEYDDEMNCLFKKLVDEKQFYTDEMRKSIEDALLAAEYWKKRDFFAQDYRFSIELTRECNMNCSFCYARSRKPASTMTRKHIDAILSFYKKYADDPRKIEETPYIRITGGEPLLNNECVRLIHYISSKWKKADILLFTNGVNLLKYYDCLPIEHIGEVHVSLDGSSRLHLSRRCPKNSEDESVFDNIIFGIQKLLSDKVNVKIKTVLDRNNYMYFDELRSFLKNKGILDSPYCEHLVGITLDFYNRLDIMEEANSKDDVKKIEAYLRNIGMFPATYPSLTIMKKMLMRVENSPCFPECVRCKNQQLSNYFFACNGKIYHCDCLKDDIGVIGNFYPEIELDNDAVKELYNRTIFSNSKCTHCTYKFLCLGGCPLSARTKGESMICGIFEEEDILDSLEFDYNMILRQRFEEKSNEIDKKFSNH